MPRGEIAKRSGTPLGDGAGAIVFASDTRTTLAADQAQAAGAYAILLTAPVVNLPVARDVDIQLTFSIAIGAGSIANLAIFVDGVLKDGAECWINGNVAQQSGAVGWRQNLAAGNHTITIQWQNIGGGGAGLFCRPATHPGLESCSVRVQVLEPVS